MSRAARKTTRDRGFVRWTPSAKSLQLLTAIDAVLEQYTAHLPITLRQLYYRLVATIAYPKDEQGYQRLGELVVKARRARRLSFEAIRDDGFVRREPAWFAGPTSYLVALRLHAASYRRDRQEGQARRVVLWCEAGGMVPQLARVAHDYGVPVYSSGGFDSVTVKHDVARTFAGLGPVEVLHVGDHDPSGVHVYASLDADVRAFLTDLGGDAVFTRLAVTPEQIRANALPTAPAKVTDKRAFAGQAEALPPDVLATIVETAITTRLDADQRHAVIAQEDADRLRLLAALARVQVPT